MAYQLLFFLSCKKQSSHNFWVTSIIFCIFSLRSLLQNWFHVTTLKKNKLCTRCAILPRLKGYITAEFILSFSQLTKSHLMNFSRSYQLQESIRTNSKKSPISKNANHSYFFQHRNTSCLYFSKETRSNYTVVQQEQCYCNHRPKLVRKISSRLDQGSASVRLKNNLLTIHKYAFFIICLRNYSPYIAQIFCLKSYTVYSSFLKIQIIKHLRSLF